MNKTIFIKHILDLQGIQLIMFQIEKNRLKKLHINKKK